MSDPEDVQRSTRGAGLAAWARALWFGAFPHQLSWMLDTPLRRLSLRAETLADRLELAPTDRLLEVGPGPGYFSVALAERLPEGELVLFDLQPEMLAKARRKLEAAGYGGRVRYDAGDAAAPLPYPDDFFDVALLVAVLGEVPDPDACLRGLRRVLRGGGRLVVHEAFPDPDMFRPSTLIERVEAAGFRLRGRVGRAWNYTATFEVEDESCRRRGS